MRAAQICVAPDSSVTPEEALRQVRGGAEVTAAEVKEVQLYINAILLNFYN